MLPDLDQPDLTIAALGAHLDALTAAQRWAALRRLNRTQQRRLYGLAAGNPVGIDDLVAGAAPLTEVVHDGLNTLPVPWMLRRFQKRFCRPAGGASGVLYGYNEGPLRRIIGPGYFIARESGEPTWIERGAVVVDYFEVPTGPVVASWPPVVRNSKGLQRNVYDHTRDFLRRVSTHVTIGAATKDDVPLDHYFVLCRRD
jgi:hypothetical protein